MTDLSTPLDALPLAVQAQASQAALRATDISVSQIVASTPNMSLVTYAPLVGKIITLLLGGYLLHWGIDVKAWTGNDWVLVLGAAVSVFGGVAAWWGRRQAAHREHQIALASAAASASATQAAGKPVEVPVQPPPAKV